MKIKFRMILAVIMILCLAGCGSPKAEGPKESREEEPTVGEPDLDVMVKVRVTVTEVEENGNSILVTNDAGEVIRIPVKYLEGQAEPKEGMVLEVTCDNRILETYPAKFAKIEKVEVLPEENERIDLQLDFGDWDDEKDQDPGRDLSGEGPSGEFGYLFSDAIEYDGNYRNRGYYVLTYNENSYFAYVICSGEHSTGGYGISVSNLELDAEGNLVVTVKETSPGIGAMVTQAFTYPRLTLMISKPAGSDKRIIVQTTNGSEFPFLGNLEDKDADVEKGSASGAGDASSKDPLDEDLGEIYVKDVTDDDVVTSSDGIKYVKNQILISAELDCTKDKIEKLGKEYGFEIVGYIEITQDYQIEFTRDVEEAELLELMKTFEEEDYISSCWLNTVSEINFD